MTLMIKQCQSAHSGHQQHHRHQHQQHHQTIPSSPSITGPKAAQHSSYFRHHLDPHHPCPPTPRHVRQTPPGPVSSPCYAGRANKLQQLAHFSMQRLLLHSSSRLVRRTAVQPPTLFHAPTLAASHQRYVHAHACICARGRRGGRGESDQDIQQLLTNATTVRK